MNQPNLSTLAARAEMRRRRFWLIDKLLPGGEFHILAGGSGMGKTTWLFQMLHQWEQGLPILGHKSHPVPWMYMNFDRGLQATTLLLDDIGLGDWDAPVFTASQLIPNLSSGFDIRTIIEHQWFPHVKLFIIDGLQAVLPDPRPGQGQNKLEMLWVAHLRELYLNHGKTIIGISHPPKSRGESKLSLRSDVLGSTSLMASASTIIKIEDVPKAIAPVTDEKTGDDKPDQRVVRFSGGRFKQFSVVYDIDHLGRFINPVIGGSPEAIAKVENERIVSTELLDYWILSEPDRPQGWKTAEIIRSATQQLGLTDRTVERWLKSACERRILVKFDHGSYRKTRDMVV